MKKNILILADSFPTKSKPSIGNFYLEQVEALKPYFDFQIIVLEARELMFLSFFKEKSFKRFTDPFDVSYDMPLIRLRFNRIRQNRITVLFTFLKNKVAIYNFETGCKAVDYGFLKHYKTDFMPDLIICETAQFMAPFAVYLGEKYKIPVVGYEHYPPFANMTTIWEINDFSRELIINSLNQLTLLFSTSQYLTNILYLIGVNSRISTIGNMVNENNFCIKPKMPSEFFYVTYVGYLNNLKDPITMFKCIKEIKKSNEEKIRFRIINGVNEFTKMIENFNIADIVENRIEVPRNDMIRIISQQTDVLVSTSTSETFGLTMVEALMSGVPVIATKSGGNQDFLTSKNSILIDNKDFKTLAESIIKIKNKKVVFNSQSLRHSVLYKYSMGAFTKNYSDQLNSIMNNVC